MASQIDTTGIDALYPRAGQNNDSQGFRDNFSGIVTNLNTAQSEITALQNETFRLDATNNFNGSLIVDSNMRIMTQVSYTSTIDNSTHDIDFTNGHYQKFTVNSNLPECTINFSNWPVSPRYSMLRLELESSAKVNMLFTPPEGTELKLDYNWPKKVLLRPEPVVLEFYTYDGGATIWGRYLYRSYTPETHPYANAEGDELVIFNVTIKDGGAGNQEIFFLDDQPVNETPELYFTPGSRYRFILEHVSNASAPLRFSTAPDTIVSDGDTNTIVPYTEGVVIDGVAGDPNAYVEIEITETTPLPLYLYAEEQPNGLDTSKIGMELAITSNPSYVRIKTANKLQDADEDTYIIAETDYEADNDELDFYIANIHRMQLKDACLRLLEGTKLCIEDGSPDAVTVDGGVKISGDLEVGGDIIFNPDLSQSTIDTWTQPNEELTNTLIIDESVNISNYKIGKTLRILGVSADSTVESGAGSAIQNVERIGLQNIITTSETPSEITAPELYTSVLYKIAEMDFITGKISPATAESSVNIIKTDFKLNPSESQSVIGFNLNNNIKLTLRRTDVNKAILIYRKIEGVETTFGLLTVLGPKDLTTATQDIMWIDFYDYDLNPWSNKTDKNSYNELSGILHVPITAPTTASYGWDYAKITAVSGSTVILDKNFYHNESITTIIDDTEELQDLINTRSTTGLNFLDIENRRHYVSKLSIPPGFSITGKGRESKLIKQYWSTDFTNNDNHVIKPKIITGEDSLFNNVSIEKIKIDGNFLNQYLLQDNTNTAVHRNYAIYLYGSRIIFEDLELSNIVGGGLFLYNTFNDQIVTEKVTIKDSIIENGCASYRYDTYAPVAAREIRNSKVLSTTMKNFPAAADFTATDKSLIITNIIDNCGSGLLTYGSVNTIYNPNILLGPSGSEFLPVADMLNTEYDSVNILIEKDIDFNSYKGLYQENGVTFDLTANNIEVVGVINQLNKTATIESLGVQYDNLIQVDALGSGNSVGEFGFRIVANSVNTILQTDETVKRVPTDAVPNADYNADYVGMVYRLIATEYVPKSGITKVDTLSVPSRQLNVTVVDSSKFRLNDVIKLNSSSLSNTSTDDADIATKEATVVAINTVLKIITVEYGVGDLNGNVTQPGSSVSNGTVDLKNRFVLVKGKIN